MGINQWTDNLDDGTGPGSTPAPRHGRAALLRLAAWFEEAEPDRAHALASAAYTLDPARHLHGRVDGTVTATTSWWQADPDHSTVVERPGNRRPEPVRDHRAQQARLRDAAESSAHWRRDGAEQIRSLLTEPTGRDAQLALTGAGMEVLTELLTAALAVGDADGRRTSAGDLEFGLRLHVLPSTGARVTVSGEGGDLALQDLRLYVTPYEQADPGPLPGIAPAEEPAPSEVPEAADEASVPDAEPVPSEVPEAPDQVSGSSEDPGRATDPSAGSIAGDDPDQEASTSLADGAPATDTLPGPAPDIESTGPIDISAHRAHRQERG
ncbi:DUF2397 family protein [Nocardiopsis xinjiangensis]|uniref:DUF2397 family protein n=1 Tax=Nocardiopsis xinjiangensis TaxID=124285 RepID=UPI00034B6AE3|nr:DUF2397 family protein [Nocardiopsis xinjiangensis]